MPKGTIAFVSTAQWDFWCESLIAELDALGYVVEKVPATKNTPHGLSTLGYIDLVITPVTLDVSDLGYTFGVICAKGLRTFGSQVPVILLDTGYLSFFPRAKEEELGELVNVYVLLLPVSFDELTTLIEQVL